MATAEAAYGSTSPRNTAKTSLGFKLQAHGVNLAPEIFSAIPYVLTIGVLVLISSVWAGETDLACLRLSERPSRAMITD